MIKNDMCTRVAKKVAAAAGLSVAAIVLGQFTANFSATNQHGESAGFIAKTSALLLNSASAQTKKPRPKRPLPGIGPKVLKVLETAGAQAQPPEDSGKKPNFREALKILEKGLANCREGCNGYEMAQIYTYLAWVSYSLDRVNDAIKYYKLVLKQSPNIPWGVEDQTLYTLAQLSFSQEKYDDALSLLRKWQRQVESVTPESYYLESQICYQKGDKRCSLTAVNKSISMIEAKGDIGKEPMYTLQRSLYIEKEDYNSAVKNLIHVNRHYPRKQNWVLLSSLYGALNREKDQLHTLETAYTMGALTKDSELRNLAYLFLGAEVPYKAGTILESGLKKKILKRNEKNLETLAISWRQSRERAKAIDVLSEVSKMSDDGDLYADLMAIYIDADDNKKAIDAGRSALKKGKLKRPGEVRMNLGIAYFNLKQYGKALEQFEAAKKYKETRRLANSWHKHATSEKSRSEQLAAALKRAEEG